MTPHAVLAAGGIERAVRPGGWVGRSPSAVLRLLDGRVSEAHAMVALRGTGLQLLALRGQLRVDDVVEDAIDLEKGVVIELAPGVELTVEHVMLPTHIVAAQVDAGRAQVLWADVYSLVRSPVPELVPGHREQALCRLFATETGWLAEIAGRTEPWSAGAVIEIADVSLRAVTLSRAEAASAPTVARGLTIVGRYDTAHVLRKGREPVLLNGQPAKLLTDLGQMATAVPWDSLAKQYWPRRNELYRRKSFDRIVQRIRRKLREHGVRTDLVRATGRGSYELFLLPYDRFDDEA